MRTDQTQKPSEKKCANDEVASDHDPAKGEAGLSSAMHDMRMLAKSYSTHSRESTATTRVQHEGTAVDPRVLLIPRQEPSSDHWKLATLMMMVLLGLSTSALAVSLAFGGSDADAPRMLLPVTSQPEEKIAPLPAIDLPVDASVSKKLPSYRIHRSPESLRVNPEKRKVVAPVVESTGDRRARILAAGQPRVSKETGCDEVACLLGDGGACCGSEEDSPEMQEMSEEVAARPHRLSREQVFTPMQSIRGRVRSCFDRYEFSGVAKVTIVIAPEGNVQSFDLDAGSEPFQACVEKLVTRLKFPQLQQPFTVSYPFTLRDPSGGGAS